MSAAKPGRNLPCPCGSGRKYKHCCQGKAAERATARTTWIAVVVVIVVLGVAAGTVVSLFRSDASDEAGGRVWSEEHGHWHDAP